MQAAWSALLAKADAAGGLAARTEKPNWSIKILRSIGEFYQFYKWNRTYEYWNEASVLMEQLEDPTSTAGPWSNWV